jgi:hypothetical protein
MKIIKNGGASYGGKMPSFKDRLSNKEIEAAIAYFQSFWLDKSYNLWIKELNGLKANSRALTNL